ncbi:MAG: AtpZ/AtpI family protein [Chloroflexi bacterium]|nr:AtpZ/AtpI family protein [Chloroflexota bacterium]
MNSRRFLLVMRLLGVGWYMAFCIVFGIGGGIWLDNRLNTSPLFVLVGVLLGSGLAFYGVYKMLVPLLTGDQNGPGSEGS